MKVPTPPTEKLPALVLYSDFDGTITEMDCNEMILDRFSSREDWMREDRLFLAGKISLEECMRRQFKTVKSTEEELIATVSDVKIRHGFSELVKHCKRRGIDLVVVSAGLDFIIRRKLADAGVSGVKIVSAVAECTPQGVRFQFPQVSGDGPDFKARLIRTMKRHGSRVYYIGDGESDFAAAAEADLIFAIRGGTLADHCREKPLPFIEVGDFLEVISILNQRS